MSGGTAVAVFVVYLLLPLSAVFLSFLAHSKFARIFLRFGGMYFGAVFGISLLLGGDCEIDDFAFHNCRLAPQVIADFVNVLSIFTMAVYFFVAPIISVWALFREMKVRQYEQFDR